jgi:hypothetical protein
MTVGVITGDPESYSDPSQKLSATPMPQRRRHKLTVRPQAAPRVGGLRRLPELLGALLEPAARRRGLAEARLLTDWHLVVGPQLAPRCQPVRLAGASDGRGGVLTVHVGGAQALELQHSAPQLIERINGFFGYPAVARLRLIQAPPIRLVKSRQHRPGRALSTDELSALATLVEPVRPPALRAALAELGRTVAAQVPDPDDHRPEAADRARGAGPLLLAPAGGRSVGLRAQP